MHSLKQKKKATEKSQRKEIVFAIFILTYSDIIGQPCHEKGPTTSLDPQSV